MKWKNGFYFDGEAPQGAVDITEKEYESLLKAQSEGMTIEDENGKPVLKDYRPKNDIREYLTKKEKLSKISEDIIQYIAGEDVPNFEERKAEFIRIHNEVRVYEGKKARNIKS